jgi:hypothetical protein
LQEITGIIARYAVMENLYNQSTSTLTLKPEYQASLLSLCVTILEWFSQAFVVWKGLGELHPHLVFSGSPTKEVARNSEKRCGKLLDEIREKDKTCQGFRVVCQVEDDDDTEAEVDAEIEDVSDDSWELVTNDETDDGAASVRSQEV